MKLFRKLFVGLLLGCGLLVVGSGCTKDNLTESSQRNLCSQACNNFAARCGVSGTSSFSGSSSGNTPECVLMCTSGLGSKSGSSSAAYQDLLHCVAAAQSCLEIQNVCSP